MNHARKLVEIIIYGNWVVSSEERAGLLGVGEASASICNFNEKVTSLLCTYWNIVPLTSLGHIPRVSPEVYAYVMDARPSFFHNYSYFPSSLYQYQIT